MRLLVFRREYRSDQLKSRWNHFPDDVSADVITVSSRHQADLESLLRAHDLRGYDRVVVDLKWRYLRRQHRTLASIPRLVIHEFDAFWNFVRESPYFMDFERVYHRLPRFRLLCCGWHVRDRFRSQGLDTKSVDKSFDESIILDTGAQRDIPVGFIGRVDGPVYRERRRMLEGIRQHLPVSMLRTRSAEEYVHTLNRIRIFISADAAMHEYTAKNFEAMAAGCLLVAYRQGGEDRHLGFRDMENVVLYRTADEAVAKIQLLLRNPELAETIAQQGRTHVRQRFTSAERDRRLISAVMDRWCEDGPYDRRTAFRQTAARILPSLRIRDA